MNAIDLKGEYDLPLFATSAVAFGLGAWLYRTRRQRLADYSFGIATATFVCGAVENVRNTRKQSMYEAKFHALIQAEKKKRPEVLKAIKDCGSSNQNWAAPLLEENDDFSNNKYIKSLLNSPDTWDDWEKFYERLAQILPESVYPKELLNNQVTGDNRKTKDIYLENFLGNGQKITFESAIAADERFSYNQPVLRHLRVVDKISYEEIEALRAMLALIKFGHVPLIKTTNRTEGYIGTFCWLDIEPNSDFRPVKLRDELRSTSHSNTAKEVE